MNLRLLTLVATALASSVHQLTDDKFGKFLQDKDLTLVEFFAPWCGHCKALEPEYEKAAETIASHDGAKLALAKVDCTEETEVCGEYEIRGYPTLLVFKGDKKVGSYDGPRSADEISSWLIRRSEPSVKELSDAKAVSALEEPIVVVGIYDKDTPEVNATFNSIADSFRDRIKFVNVPTKAAKDYDVKAPAVVVVKDGKITAAESIEEEDLAKFVNVESFPAFGVIGPNNYLDYTQSGIPLLFAFVEDDEQRKNIESWITPHLDALHGKANVVFLDVEKFGGHADNVNIKKEWPAIVVHDIDSNKKYPHDQSAPLSAKSIKKYINDFIGDKIEPSIKSEPIPESQDGPVHILVGKEYDSVVLDDDRDVLVEFYAPWCGHCKTLSPIYDQLGESYAGVDTVRIAKVDHTVNEVPDQIQGYPTIKLFPAGDKKNPITFSGGRTLEELQKFIEENGTHKAVASPVEDSAHEEL